MKSVHTFFDGGSDMGVDEKSRVVLAQYDIAIWDSYRARGAHYLRTEQGLLMLRGREAKEGRVVYEEMLKTCGIAGGFAALDLCVKNRDGNYVTEGDYGETFLLRHWREGEECNLQDPAAAVQAAEGLGHFHNGMRGCPVQEEYVQEGLDQMFLRRIREMRRIETYLRKRKQKTDFEAQLQEVLPEYRKKAEQVLAKLSESDWQQLMRDSVDRGLVYHGNYGSHSVVLLPKGVFVTDFEHAQVGLQVTDLYYLMRKTMEKHDWNVELWAKMLSAYEEGRALSETERQVLWCLLAFPEKFTRVCNRYFNMKKSWIPGKNAQKLQMVLNQEEQKQAALRKMANVL